MKKKFELNNKTIGLLTIILASLTALSPFAIDTYAPAMPFMAKNLGVALHNIELSLTIYVIGYALGQFFGGPLSDNIGRKPVVYIGLTVFLISSFLLANTNTLTGLYLFRFTQALGGGFSIVVSMAIVRDLFSGVALAKRISYIGMFMMAAPLVAPAVGTFLLKFLGWRSIFLFLGCYSALVIGLILVFIPETKDTKIKRTQIKQLVYNYLKVLKNTQSISLILAAALGFSGMYTFITGSSKLYLEYFKLPLEIYPLLFGSNVLLMIILGGINARLVTFIKPIKILNIGLLIQLIVGGLLFVFMGVENPVFWIVFPLIVIFVGVLGLIFANANAIVLEMYPNSSGTTSALIGVIEFSVAGIIGFVSNIFQNETIAPIGIIMFACTLGANLSFRVLRKL